jgi:hypothetical protein
MKYLLVELKIKVQRCIARLFRVPIITAQQKSELAKLLDTEEGKRIMARAITTPLIPQPRKPPPGTKCGKCGSENVLLFRSLLGGAYSGWLKCQEPGCGHQEGVMHYLGRNMVVVEPLPENKELYFTKEEK